MNITHLVAALGFCKRCLLLVLPTHDPTHWAILTGPPRLLLPAGHQATVSASCSEQIGTDTACSPAPRSGRRVTRTRRPLFCSSGRCRLCPHPACTRYPADIPGISSTQSKHTTCAQHPRSSANLTTAIRRPISAGFVYLILMSLRFGPLCKKSRKWWLVSDVPYLPEAESDFNI